MWQTDTVKILVKQTTSGYAGPIITWIETGGTDVVCDVQDINKEVVFKTYGIDGEEFKQVFDRTLSALWVKGSQVKYDGRNWWIKLVNKNMSKMSLSNHVFVILEAVQ